jgi:hypothetical protein
MGVLPSMIGVSWLGVLVTASLPPFSATTHAQPLPNRPAPAAFTASFILSSEPNAPSIAFARSPAGAAGPPGFMISQNSVWL